LKDKIKVIGFDADDTLWVNEPYYREVEEAFIELIKPYETERDIAVEVFNTEMSNLSVYGYGIKSFVLSLVQCALEITDGRVNSKTIGEILQLGKDMLARPIELLEDVKPLLEQLSGNFKLIVATKGDLFDQEKKMKRSSIASFFHHIEVMSDKKEQNYIQLLQHLDIDPCEFIMIGNSMKSDIIPTLNLGSYAIHVPFHTTWAHEEVDEDPVNRKFFRVKSLTEVEEIIALV
jgi:putative hydrolase of the HAD superfamily